MADTNEDMDVMNEDDMVDEEFFEAIKGILMAIQAIIHLLAATNFDLEFIYVLSGWEGSAHDSRVLNDALSKFLLVDAGFANRRGFLAPIRGVRYHLKEFSGQGRHPENARELFNLHHASLRNVVERIFGVLKSRFTIFKTAPPFPFKKQAELVLACAGLHNFLRKECRSDLFPVEPEDEEDSEHEEDPEDEFQTQDQQREEANDWRMEIANHMWRDARPAPDPEPNPPLVVEGNNAAEQS
ncbi:uncharacterized protein LOC112202302 [Rosa chinensis]|uniref:uncharacterized protein LOC112202302 n=1 Tax=Rosa chinensis TaxID=74649 RepID=UPI000D090F39|nr:uncharacterized protein LOC112202302 [Rosa chinensis]